MRSLLERLAAGETLVSDGAVGTLLMARGLKPGECPESVNLSRPEILEEIARSYAEAGAEIVHTNTFGGSPLKLSAHGLADRAEHINRTAVLAVRRAVGDRAYVSASCGPSGRMLKPHGDVRPDELYDSFRQQMAYLVNAGVDCVCVETMVDLSEATLAVKAAKDVSPDTPVTAAMTFDATPNGFFTIMGVDIPSAVAGLQDAGADVVGSNCGNGFLNMIEIARAFRKATDLPLIIQSNAGLPSTTNGVLTYDETPAFMADKASELLAIGTSIIGGCCGTTPEHIKAIRETVDSWACQERSPTLQ